MGFRPYVFANASAAAGPHAAYASCVDSPRLNWLVRCAGAAAGALVLWLMNRSRVMAVGPYVAVGLVIWLLVYKSGIHATLAGVAAITMMTHQSRDLPGTARTLHAALSMVALLASWLFIRYEDRKQE